MNIYRRLTQRWLPDSSASSSRCAMSHGLGYDYSTSWVVTRLKTPFTFKISLQFERKYSTQGSGAPYHVSFGFFSGFCGVILAELQIDPQLESTIRPKAQGLHSTREDFKTTQGSAGVPSSLEMLQVLLRTFVL
jgi:hypothetical protein